MKKKSFTRLLSAAVAATMAVTCSATLIGCKKNDDSSNTGKKKDAIVIMTEELNGLYNPFYATAGTDMDVVGMTQLSMLTTDSNGKIVAGDNEATVAKAYKVEQDANGDSVYTFVLKNGLRFSDGVPLTINDVMFNMYEYLDPVYSGSSTMYSVKIKGLKSYRTQKYYSDESQDVESETYKKALTYANERIRQLVSIFEDKGRDKPNSTTYNLSIERMKEEIAKCSITPAYKKAVGKTDDEDCRQQILDDYELTLTTFKKELETDFKTARSTEYDLTQPPYNKCENTDLKELFENDVFKFFLAEGYVEIEYGLDKNNKKDYSYIKKFKGYEEYLKSYTTEEQAINKVYIDKVESELNQILNYWGTANTIRTQFIAEAKDVLLHTGNNSGSLKFPYIEGIRSLGHVRAGSTDTLVEKVTIDGKDYKVASGYNEDGTVKNNDEYAVLQITIDDIDPKAIYNFGFSVAPVHYYTADTEHPNGREVDIANNKYGVEWGDSTFQSKTIQSRTHVEIPVGAGPYKATDESNSDNPSGSAFISSNIVYYKANHNFMFDVKTEKLQMKVTNAANAIDNLASGELDYIVPQFTRSNYNQLQALESKGIEIADCFQLGYGYIGINAGKVPNVGIRRAIMSAMQTSLAVEFYVENTCKTIDWPMSMESWAYPLDAGGASKNNGHDYTMWTGIEDAKAKIKKYEEEAKKYQGKIDKNIKFTIAGASITDHPTYAVFKQAAEILNDCGWNVEVKADSSALTKLATGSLAVWAAAWGSTIDPDMYQVYHKNSGATSVLAWGYNAIKADTTTYAYEWDIINGELSDLIDEARTIDSSTETGEKARAAKYEKAMSLVLDLAVEMPVYQRENLYAFNGKTIKGFNKNVNKYTSPLEKIWELELVG